jgi:hypothetical protein
LYNPDLWFYQVKTLDLWFYQVKTLLYSDYWFCQVMKWTHFKVFQICFC